MAGGWYHSLGCHDSIMHCHAFRLKFVLLFSLFGAGAYFMLGTVHICKQKVSLMVCSNVDVAVLMQRIWVKNPST